MKRSHFDPIDIIRSDRDPSGAPDMAERVIRGLGWHERPDALRTSEATTLPLWPRRILAAAVVLLAVGAGWITSMYIIPPQMDDTIADSPVGLAGLVEPFAPQREPDMVTALGSMAAADLIKPFAAIIPHTPTPTSSDDEGDDDDGKNPARLVQGSQMQGNQDSIPVEIASLPMETIRTTLHVMFPALGDIDGWKQTFTAAGDAG